MINSEKSIEEVFNQIKKVILLKSKIFKREEK